MDRKKVDGDFIIGEDSIWASQKITSKIFGTTQSNISMHFSDIIQDEELIKNEVSISSKDSFVDHHEFVKKSLKNLKKGGKPQRHNLDAMISIE